MRRYVFRKSLEMPKLSQRPKLSSAMWHVCWFRVWCFACVERQARGGPHRRQDVGEKSVAQVRPKWSREDCRGPGGQRHSNEDGVRPCGFPKSLTDEHRTEEIIKDLKKLECSEVRF